MVIPCHPNMNGIPNTMGKKLYEPLWIMTEYMKSNFLNKENIEK